jgi:hypothetical protein
MQYPTENIQNYLRTAYSYEDLVAQLAHAEDGELSYASCSCLIAAPTGHHALLRVGEYCEQRLEHLAAARALPYALAAEEEFNNLGNPGDGLTPWTDELRRQRVIPLIRAEILRRDGLKAQSTVQILDAEREMTVA